MALIKPLFQEALPLPWANLEGYRNSKAHRKEIYTNAADGDEVSALTELFFHLFGPVKEQVLIYDKSWWDVCLGTWDIVNDKYDYTPEGKSIETSRYLTILHDAGITADFSGTCSCLDWNGFLPVILDCIVSHAAPYSPIFYSKAHDFFFYFHHTGSIGIYYPIENEAVKGILERAAEKYELRD